MKKIIFVAFALVIPFIITSCQNNTNEVKNNESEHSGMDHKKDSTAGTQMYICPMHPEVISANKDDKCPKCGMSLEPMQSQDESKKLHSEYAMDFKAEPGTVKSGEDVTLHFTLRNTKTNEIVKKLEVVHEKILHLIIISKNLAYFDHLHPEMGTEGRLTVKTKFPHGGNYILYSDVTPSGQSHNEVFTNYLKVEGEPIKDISMTPRLFHEVEGYKADLKTTPEKLTKGKPTSLTVTLSKNGKPVNNLQNYLGALGHMVVISEDTEQYLHVHPMESSDNGHNKHNMKNGNVASNEVMFHTNFTKTGVYKVFAQFNPGGKIITTNFVIKVD